MGSVLKFIMMISRKTEQGIIPPALAIANYYKTNQSQDQLLQLKDDSELGHKEWDKNKVRSKLKTMAGREFWNKGVRGSENLFLNNTMRTIAKLGQNQHISELWKVIKAFKNSKSVIQKEQLNPNNQIQMVQGTKLEPSC